MYTPLSVCSCFSSVFSSTPECPLTTDLILRVNVRTTNSNNNGTPRIKVAPRIITGIGVLPISLSNRCERLSPNPGGRTTREIVALVSNVSWRYLHSSRRFARRLYSPRFEITSFAYHLKGCDILPVAQCGISYHTTYIAGVRNVRPEQKQDW